MADLPPGTNCFFKGSVPSPSVFCGTFQFYQQVLGARLPDFLDCGAQFVRVDALLELAQDWSVPYSLYQFNEHRFWVRTVRFFRRSGRFLLLIFLEVFPGRNFHPLLFFLGGFRPLLCWFFFTADASGHTVGSLNRLRVSVSCGRFWLPSSATSLILGGLNSFIFCRISSCLSLLSWSQSRYCFTWDLSLSKGSGAFSVTSSSSPKISSRILLFIFENSILIPRVAREVFGPLLQIPACRGKASIMN